MKNEESGGKMENCTKQKNYPPPATTLYAGVKMDLKGVGGGGGETWNDRHHKERISICDRHTQYNIYTPVLCPENFLYLTDNVHEKIRMVS